MNELTPNIPFEYKGIGSILKANRLKVPLNQREYSWEEKQVVELFQDIGNAIHRRKPSYFLGTIVLARGTKNIPEIIDGQQRLATMSILLGAIRDYFFNKNDKTLQESVDNEFLTTIDRGQRERVPKLSLNIDDNEYFRRRIICLPDSKERKEIKEEKKESHKRINSAAQKAIELLDSILKGTE